MILLIAITAIAAPVTQWVWSTHDLTVLSAARQKATVGAALEIGEIRFAHGALRTRLGMSPHAAQDTRAFVIRIDDSLHPVLREQADPLVAAIARLVELTRDAHMPLQIDYDCPVRLLPSWAQIVAALRRTLGDQRELWLTSILAHVGDDRYGGLFRETINGHVLQLFDTGELPRDVRIEALAATLRRIDMPYGLGIAVFERATRTDNRAWRGLAQSLSNNVGFRGWFVFTAGVRWTGDVR